MGEAKRLARHYHENYHKLPEVSFTFGMIPDREWVNALSGIIREYIDITQGTAA
jgi:hypothetical protein